jgi:hypothetical protein
MFISGWDFPPVDLFEGDLLLIGILDVGVDEQTVHLRVDVLDGDLEAVETARLCHLHLLAETFHLGDKMGTVNFRFD